MNNITKMKIFKPVDVVFEAFVDPSKIGNFWFSSSSARWEQGKTITLRHEEYNAEGDIHVLEVLENEKIVFSWGSPEEQHEVTILFKQVDQFSTVVVITEEGFQENDKDLLLKIIDNKEGWVFTLTCLKAYVEFGVNELRTGIVKG